RRSGSAPLWQALAIRSANFRSVLAIHSGEVSWVHRLASSEPRNPANPGGVRDGMVPSPRHGWGLPHGGQLGHAFPSALSTGSTSRLTAQFFAFWPTAPSLAGTHCQSATSPVGLRRGLDFNQLEAGITPRHPPLLFKEGNVSALKQSVNSFTRSQPWVSMCRNSQPK